MLAAQQNLPVSHGAPRKPTPAAATRKHPTPLAALHTWAKTRARQQAGACRAHLTNPLAVATNPTETRFRHWWHPIAWWDYRVDECWGLRVTSAHLTKLVARHALLAPTPSGPSAARSAEGLTLASNPHRASTALRASLARGPPRASGRSLTPQLWEQQHRYTDPSGFHPVRAVLQRLANTPQAQWWMRQGEALAKKVADSPAGKAAQRYASQAGSWAAKVGRDAVTKASEVVQRVQSSQVQAGADTAKAAPKLFSTAETEGLKRLFGSQLKGAQEALKGVREGTRGLPEGVTRGTLERYKEQIVTKGLQDIPVQQERLRVIEELLKR